MAAFIFSVISGCYIFYYENIRKNKDLAIAPVYMHAKYNREGWSYEISLAFLNDGNVDILASDVRLAIRIPNSIGLTPTAILSNDPIIIKPGGSAVLSQKKFIPWNSDSEILLKSIKNAYFTLSYAALNTDGDKLRRSIRINTIHRKGAFVMPFPQDLKRAKFHKSAPNPPAVITN